MGADLWETKWKNLMQEEENMRMQMENEIRYETEE